MLIRDIAKDYDITLIFITSNNIKKYCKKYNILEEDLYNNSEIFYSDEADKQRILLGIYDDKELRIAAFSMK